MKPVIIDRGIYKLGRNNRSTGERTEPQWESTEEGNSIVIGHEGEEFSISDKNDIEFVLTELNERLKLNYVAKVEKESFGNDEEYYRCSRCKEVFEKQDLYEEELMKFCYNCGAVLNWKDVIEDEEDR